MAMIQWPLILAGTFLAWCAGTFGCQCALALKGEARRGQLAAWAVSLVLLAVGALGIFLRMQRWERIFNSFSNLGSTITQAMLAMVALAAVAVVYLVVMRRNDGEVPKAMAAVGLLAALALAFTAGRMLVVSSRSVEDVVTSVVAVYGNALLLGPATMAVICSFADKGRAAFGTPALAGAAVNALATAGVLAYTQFSLAAAATGTVAQYGFDPTKPTAGMSKASMLPFGADNLEFSLAAIAAALIALVFAALGKKRGSWKVFGPLAVACGLVGAVCLRVVLLQVGVSAISMR